MTRPESADALLAGKARRNINPKQEPMLGSDGCIKTILDPPESGARVLIPIIIDALHSQFALHFA